MNTATPAPPAKDDRPAVARPKPKALKTYAWVYQPFSLPDGTRLGFFMVREGRKRDDYRAALEYMDDLSQTWAVSKKQSDGTFAAAYRVTLPAPGCGGQRFRTCDGARYTGHCRHSSSLAVLLAQLL
jgi:hypothetical protein